MLSFITEIFSTEHMRRWYGLSCLLSSSMHSVYTPRRNLPMLKIMLQVVFRKTLLDLRSFCFNWFYSLEFRCTESWPDLPLGRNHTRRDLLDKVALSDTVMKHLSKKVLIECEFWEWRFRGIYSRTHFSANKLFSNKQNRILGTVLL